MTHRHSTESLLAAAMWPMSPLAVTFRTASARTLSSDYHSQLPLLRYWSRPMGQSCSLRACSDATVRPDSSRHHPVRCRPWQRHIFAGTAAKAQVVARNIEYRSGLLICGHIGPVAGVPVGNQLTFYLRLGPGSVARTLPMERPPILHAGSAPVGLAPRSQQHKRTSRPGDPGMSPAQVYGGYMTGLSPVHGRHSDRLCRIQSLTADIGNPLRHDTAAPAARLCRLFHPSGSDGHSANASTAASMRWGWYRSGSLPRPQARTRPARRPARAGRRRTEPAGRDVRHIVRRAVPAPG